MAADTINEKSSSSSSREKIINSTLKLLAKTRDIKFTVRDIIQEAKVNIASVNYYFGSKAKLLSEIQEIFFAKISELNNQIQTDFQNHPKEAISEWVYQLMAYLIENTGMIYFIRKLIVMEPSSNIFHKQINDEYLEILNQYLEEIFPNLNKRDIHFKTLQIVTSLFLPLAFSFESLKEIYSYDVTNPNQRRLYVQSLLDIILRS